jgi:hypothetical protein
MYSTIEKIYGLSNSSTVSNSNTPIFRESFTSDNGDKTVITPYSGKREYNIPPDVWGPLQWKSLHYSASGYEENPNAIVQKLMRDRINALPIEIPCASCRSHCLEYIEKSNLNDVVKSRNNLFEFFVNFHNAVNKRLNKPQVSIDEAYKMYNY